MGSGVGITAYGTHRVGGEGYRFAMPETAIGLFPGFGTSYTFARFPDEIGMYLALRRTHLRRRRCVRLRAFDALYSYCAL